MIEVFIERGDQLAKSRALMKDDSDYVSALALVSVHSAIAFNDALLIKLTGKYVATQDHMEAVRKSKSNARQKRFPLKVFISLKSSSPRRLPFHIATRERQ